MAIDLPPALPPQLTTLESIERYASSSSAPYVGIVNGYELRVTGEHYLSREEMDKIFAAANTPSQAIILMSSYSVRKGHLLVSMQYAPDATVVHVHALQAQIADVKGEAMAEYFNGLKGDEDLTRAEFDRARVMANVRSERIGVNYSAAFEVDESNPENVTLVFEGEPVDDHDPTDVFVQFGNGGSRFVGRYFGDVGISHNFDNGTRAGAAYQTAFTDLGESREGEDYHRFQLTADRAFAYGLYGITASHTEYAQDLGTFQVAGTTPSTGLEDIPLLGGLVGGLAPVLESLLGGGASGGGSTQQIDLNADIDMVLLSGEQVLSSDLNYRLNLFQRAEYIDSQIEVDTLGSLQDEKYGTLEVGVKYFSAMAFNQQLLRWSAQFSVKGGVTGDSGTLGTYDEFAAANANAPEVAPAARTAEFILLKPKASVKLPVSAEGSINGEFIAQYSDEQVPQQQQWVLGGTRTISAYLPGVLAGDSGYYGTVNYLHKFPTSGFDLSGAVFVEYGAAWYENVSGPLGDERSIADVGVRMTADLGWDITVDAVVARKVADDGFEDEDELDDLEADFYFVLKKVF